MNTIWQKGRPESVYGAFIQTERQYGSRPFLCTLPEVASAYDSSAGVLTYSEARADVEVVAKIFAEAGYGPGHRIAILLENRPAFFLTWFALNSLGVSVVPINPDLRPEEVRYLLGHSEVAAAVVLPSRRDDITAAALASGNPVPVVALGEVPSRPSNPVSRRRKVASCHDECAVLYTSGTTGYPKGCVLTNEYFLMAGEWYAGIGGLCAMHAGYERMLTPLPTFHMNAMATSTMTMLILGGCLIPLDRFHPRTWWHCVRQSRATVVHYLGVMPAILMGAPESADDRHHQVRFGFGAAVPRELHLPFEQRFGFPLVEAWAMTETGAGAVIAATHEPRHPGMNCIGRPCADLEVRLIRDDGADATNGEPGELLVRRRGLQPRRGFFDRYLKDPQATASAWADGWFHTGDLVRRDAEGQFYFVDRNKNIIRRSGENISAVELERMVGEHPCVKGVAVAAVPDAVRGDEVFACIEPRIALASTAEREATAMSLVHWCASRMAYFKVPGYVAFVDSLPVTSTQKIHRRALRELAASLLADGQFIDTRVLKKR